MSAVGAASSDALLARLGMPEVTTLLADIQEHPQVRALLAFAITGRALTNTEGLCSIQAMARNLHVGVPALTGAMQKLSWLDKEGRVSDYAIGAGFMEIKFWPVKEAQPRSNYRKYERFFMTEIGAQHMQEYLSSGLHEVSAKKGAKGKKQSPAKKTLKRNKSQLYNKQQYLVKRAEIAQVVETQKRKQKLEEKHAI